MLPDGAVARRRRGVAGAARRGLAQLLPTEVVRHTIGFVAPEALLCLRSISRGVKELCPEFAVPRRVAVHFWSSRVGRRTATYVPRRVDIEVNGYVTLAAVKRRVADAAGVAGPRPFDRYTLIPGPDAGGGGGGGVLRADSDPLRSAPASGAAEALYLVPPPLRPGEAAPLVVIKPGNDALFLNRSEFHHVAPGSTFAALAEQHRRLRGGAGADTFARSPDGAALPAAAALSDQGLSTGGTLFEVY